MQAVGFGTLVRGPAGALAMLIVCCLSRTALLICCLRVVPAARPGGLGALVAGAVARPAMIIIGLLALVIGSACSVRSAVPASSAVRSRSPPVWRLPPCWSGT